MNESENINQFFEFIDEPKYHSLAEEEYFIGLLNKIYTDLDEMAEMVFTNKEVNQDTIRDCRKILLQVFSKEYLMDLQTVEREEPEEGSKLQGGSRFDATLAQWSAD
jgi:hypothetical protein